MYKRINVKFLLHLSDFNDTNFFFDRFSKKYPQISNVIKIRPLGAELFHEDGRTDGQTDMTKQIVAFGSFAKAPQNC